MKDTIFEEFSARIPAIFNIVDFGDYTTKVFEEEEFGDFELCIQGFIENKEVNGCLVNAEFGSARRKNSSFEDLSYIALVAKEKDKEEKGVIYIFKDYDDCRALDLVVKETNCILDLFSWYIE